MSRAQESSISRRAAPLCSVAPFERSGTLLCAWRRWHRRGRNASIEPHTCSHNSLPQREGAPALHSRAHSAACVSLTAGSRRVGRAAAANATEARRDEMRRSEADETRRRNPAMAGVSSLSRLSDRATADSALAPQCSPRPCPSSGRASKPCEHRRCRAGTMASGSGHRSSRIGSSSSSCRLHRGCRRKEVRRTNTHRQHPDATRSTPLRMQVHWA